MQSKIGYKQNQSYAWYVTNNSGKKINENAYKTQWIKYLIKVLFISLCCMGCGYHVYSIVSLYIQRPTTVVIRTETSPKFELPAVSVCVYTIMTLNKMKLIAQIPEVNEILKKPEFHEEKYQNLSAMGGAFRIRSYQPNANYTPFTDEDRDKIIDELIKWRKSIANISSLGPNFTEIIQKCFVSQNYSMNCFELSPVLTSINSRYKCFTLFQMKFEERWDSDKFKIDRHHGEEYDLIEMSLNFYTESIVNLDENRGEMFVIVHPPHEKPSPQSSGVLKIDQGQRVEATISKVSINELPYPYESDCINYTDIGFESRKDCFEKCKIDLTLKQTKERDAIDVMSLDHNQSHHKWINNLMGNLSKDCCREQCKRHDCINEYYHLEKTSDSEISCLRDEQRDSRLNFKRRVAYKRWDSTHPCAKVYLKLSTFPMLVYKHMPKIETVEFLCYVGSITGLWLGVSVLSFECWINKICSAKFKSLQIY